MGRRKFSGKRKAQVQLLEKGIEALALGMLFLVGPHFIANPLIAQSVGKGLQSVGWLILLIGACLLGLHFFVRSRQFPTIRQSDSRASPQPEAPVQREWPAEARVQALTPRAPAADVPPRAALAPSVTDRPPIVSARRRETAWSAKVLDDIEWRRFEAVCEALFAQGGFETRSQSHGADGGVDIWLHSKNSTGPAAVVQCKHWTKPVGVKEVREFFGVMASHRLQRGTYVATSGFTPDAQKFAKENGINAMAGDRLLTLIASRTPEQQRDLLNVAYEGEYWRPTCASCGPKMVERPGGKGRPPFWGCTNFPRCRSTLPMRQAA
jgi:restriction system protein